MAETIFPLPADVTEEERATLRQALSTHTKVLGQDERGVRFEGEAVGQTGPVHHFQYFRLYRVAGGYLAIGHDLREGMRVAHAERAEDLPEQFDVGTVREFIEDELRYRGVIGAGAST